MLGRGLCGSRAVHGDGRRRGGSPRAPFRRELDGDRGAVAGQRRDRVEPPGIAPSGVVRAEWLHGRRRVSRRRRRRACPRGRAERHGCGNGGRGSAAGRRRGDVQCPAERGVVPGGHRLRRRRAVPERDCEQSNGPARLTERHHLDTGGRARPGERRHGVRRPVDHHDGLVLEPRRLWGGRPLQRRRRAAAGPLGCLRPGAGLLVGGLRRRDLQLRARVVLPGLHGRPAPQRTHGGHGNHTGRRGVLGGGFRRRHLQLRQRRLPRLDRQPAAEQAHRGDGDHTRWGGLLARRLRRRHLQLRRRRLLRLDGLHPPQPAHRRHGGHPGRARLLARRLRRRHLQLRRRQLLRLGGRPSTSTSPWSA